MPERSLLHYSGLIALDARGRRLPARLELHGSRLLIRVADTGARYPLTVDPLFTSSAQPRVFMSPLVKRGRRPPAQPVDRANAVDFGG